MNPKAFWILTALIGQPLSIVGYQKRYYCSIESTNFICWTNLLGSCSSSSFNRTEAQNSTDYISCNGDCYLPRDKICSGDILCDIIPCKWNCFEKYFKCKKSDRCVPRKNVCNGIHGDECLEDHEYDNGPGFKCLRNERKCVLPQQLLHDNIPDCDGGADLCFGLKSSSRSTVSESLDRQKCYRCLDGLNFVPRKSVCDGVMDCPDLSDECICQNKPTICNRIIKRQQQSTLNSAIQTSINTTLDKVCDVAGNVRCGNGQCVQKSAICDGIIDCDIDEDFSICRGTKLCANTTDIGRTCRCSRIKNLASQGIFCDGFADCKLSLPPVPDSQYYSGSVFGDSPEDECSSHCPKSNFTCRLPYRFTMIGPGVSALSCPDKVMLIKMPNGKTLRKILKGRLVSPCNSVIECPDGSDESESRCSRLFKCEADERRVVWIRRSLVCDGTANCASGRDESKEFCNTTRFFCDTPGNKKSNYDPSIKCDGVITCDDSSDEIGCNDGRFYCEGGKPLFVSKNQKFDGRRDCEDWSDECPSVNQSASGDPFSSRYELIANPILRVFVWIMGIFATIGNAVVIIRGIQKLLTQQKARNTMARMNLIFVINLAASDILMGVYLIGIGIAAASFSGKYCAKDQQWRSSKACITLGVLSVLSSETSVLTMAWMTFTRLYNTIRPYTSKLTVKIIWLMVTISWIFSLIISLLPLIPTLSATFTSRVSLTYNPYTANALISIGDARNMFKDLMEYNLKPNVTPIDDNIIYSMNWQGLESEAKRIFSQTQMEIEYYFGYYSTSSVCIPKFFVTKSDPAWIFSFSLNLFNFVAFLFVLGSYIAIYFKSQRGAHIRKDDTAAKALQTKIARLIVTDFCCWVPICIMAFAKLSGAPVPDIAYVIAAIILLPINSALNPLLYSDLPDILVMRVKRSINILSTTTTTTEVETTEKTQTVSKL